MACATKIQAVVRGKKQRRLFQNTAAQAARTAGAQAVKKKLNVVALMDKALGLTETPNNTPPGSRPTSSPRGQLASTAKLMAQQAAEANQKSAAPALEPASEA